MTETACAKPLLSRVYGDSADVQQWRHNAKASRKTCFPPPLPRYGRFARKMRGHAQGTEGAATVPARPHPSVAPSVRTLPARFDSRVPNA